MATRPRRVNTPSHRPIQQHYFWWQDIAEERIMRGPLIKLPHTIRITTEVVKQKLATILQAAGLPDVQDTKNSAIMAGTNLEPFLPVGLFIAYERNKGKGSFWHPYLDMLPEQPECAWLMQPEQLISALAAAKKPLDAGYPHHCFTSGKGVDYLTLTSSIGGRTGVWRAIIDRHRNKAGMQADAVAEIFGKESHVNSDDVMCGLGQVQVRCFGPPWGPYLMPGIDLCNHSPNAAPAVTPQPLRRGKKKMCVSSVMDRAPKALAAGDELCISYNYGQRHPDPEAAQEQCYQAFLTRGFVPDEYLSARRSEKDRILAPAWLDKLALLINDADTTSQEPVCPR